MNIGVFGGSFDPVHFGHLKCAEALVQQGLLDKVLFMPTGNPPHKDSQSLTPAKHRLKMLELAIGEYPQFEISSYELRRKKTSYTIDTLAHLKKENPSDHYFFVLGADNLKTIHTWKNYRDLIAQNEFLLVQRPGFSLEVKKLPHLTKEEFKKLTEHQTNTPLLKTSATLVRALLKHSSKSTQKHTPEKVWTYILSNKLYF